jgi:hypothetical protein
MCRIKLGDDNDDANAHSCSGYVNVPCGGELEFYYGPNGSQEFKISNGRRSLMNEADAAKAVVAGALPSPSIGAAADVATSMEERVKDATSSSLRGGAKGSKRPV